LDGKSRKTYYVLAVLFVAGAAVYFVSAILPAVMDQRASRSTSDGSGYEGPPRNPFEEDWEKKVKQAPGSWIEETEAFFEAYHANMSYVYANPENSSQFDQTQAGIAEIAALYLVLGFADELSPIELDKKLDQAGVKAEGVADQIERMQNTTHRDVWRKINLETLTMLLYNHPSRDSPWNSRESPPGFLSDIKENIQIAEVSADVVSEDGVNGEVRTYFLLHSDGTVEFSKTYTYHGGRVLRRRNAPAIVPEDG